jgi:hypothetical protein
MRPEFTVTKKGLENYIDEIARGHLTHFVMNLNCQRANFPSKTFEPIWKSLDEPERDHLDYIRALKALYESGVDPYKVWIDRCRVKGVKPWISIRMNDLHRHDVPKSPWISTFWHEHPEYRLRPDGWDNGLDYTLEPVRKRMLDFITEVLNRYDPEGLELDLMRFRRYLPIGREKECAPIFTAYMREIRKVVNAAAAKRGHTITLSVRLKSKPSGSRELGMEADVWAKEGIVDVIVPTSPWESFDFDIPLAEWRTWTGDKVLIVPSADEAITENGKRRIATLEEYRRWASIMHERGAKGLYLFNFFMHPQDGTVWNGVLSGGLAPLAALHAADDAKLKALERSPISNRWGKVKPSKIQVEHVTVFRGREGESYNHVAELNSHDGKLYATWALGLRDEEAPGQRMVMAVSEDHGRTWSAPTTIAPSRHGKAFQTNVSSCGLRILPDGRFVAYSAEWEWEPDAYNPDGSRRDHPISDPAMGHEKRMWRTDQGRTEARVSNDNGRTWSEPVVVAPKQEGYFSPVKVRSGRLILPGNFGVCHYTDDPAGLIGWKRASIPGIPESHYDSYFHSFQAAKLLGIRERFSEACVYQTDDGVIRMMLRTEGASGGNLGVTESRDNGLTWSAPMITDFADSACRAHFGKLPDGRFFAVSCPPGKRGQRRTPLVLAISEDGVTFDRHFILGDEPSQEPRIPGKAKGGRYGYPYLHVMGDEAFVIYTVEKDDVAVGRFPLSAIR